MKGNKHIQSFNEHQENLNSELSKETSSSISDVRSSEKSFEGDLTAENIYKYYLEQTGDEDKAKELVDKLISKFDELIEKGEK
jgi:hypothetical protein